MGLCAGSGHFYSATTKEMGLCAASGHIYSSATKEMGLCAGSRHFYSETTKKMGPCAASRHFFWVATWAWGAVCGIEAFLLGNDLGVVSSTTSVPPIYTYLQFSQVTGTDIDFLNNHNFLICGVGAYLLGSDQGNGAVCGIGAFLLGNDLGMGGSATSLPPIYTYLQFSQVTGTDIDFLNNHNF